MVGGANVKKYHQERLSEVAGSKGSALGDRVRPQNDSTESDEDVGESQGDQKTVNHHRP
jgi:hypothetical protein